MVGYVSGGAVVVGGAGVAATGPHTASFLYVQYFLHRVVSTLWMYQPLQVSCLNQVVPDIVPVETRWTEALDWSEVDAGIVTPTGTGVLQK